MTDQPEVHIPAIADLVPLADPAHSSPAESDQYAERTNVVIIGELAKYERGTIVTVVYPNGSSDQVRLDEEGDIEAVTPFEIPGEDDGSALA